MANQERNIYSGIKLEVKQLLGDQTTVQRVDSQGQPLTISKTSQGKIEITRIEVDDASEGVKGLITRVYRISERGVSKVFRGAKIYDPKSPIYGVSEDLEIPEVNHQELNSVLEELKNSKAA